MSRSLEFVVPGDIQTPTGGYIFDTNGGNTLTFLQVNGGNALGLYSGNYDPGHFVPAPIAALTMRPIIMRKATAPGCEAPGLRIILPLMGSSFA